MNSPPVSVGSLCAMKGVERIEVGDTLAPPRRRCVMVFLESIAGGAPATTRPEVDERAARRTLRAQIARLERDLGAAVIAAYPRLPAGTARVSHAGPRLLGLAELERIRDDLAERLSEVREQAAAQAERQAQHRLLVQRLPP